MKFGIEIWKDIMGYEGLYQVSSLGRIKSLPKKMGRPDSNRQTNKRGPIILKSKLNPKNKKSYHRVNLGSNNTITIHRLVATAFIPNPENKPTVNHIDGDKNNNCASNLEWATHKENNNHAYDLGLNKPQIQNLRRWAK